MCLPGKLSNCAAVAPAQSPASMCAVAFTSSWLWEKDGVCGALQGAEHVEVAAGRVFWMVASGHGVLDGHAKLPASLCAAALLCACVGATVIVNVC